MIATEYIIFYLICTLNIFWGIRKKKSNALYGIAMAVIFVLMTFNFDGPDIGVYRTAYEEVGEASGLQNALNATYMERGYAFLMFSANKIGLDFYAFRIFISIICLALFASTIKFYKVNPNFIIGLYMVYIFFFDTIQLRNCIIEFIILYATRYLYKRSDVVSIFKYIICIAVAGTIHTLSWLFLSLLFLSFFKNLRDYKSLFIISASMFVACVLLQPVFPKIVDMLVKLLRRGSGYFSSTIRFGYWAVMALNMIALIPLYLYRKKVTNEEAKNKIDFIMKIEIVTGLFIPLAFINNNFNRIFRNILILDTIGLTVLYENLKKHTEANDITLSAQILLVGGWFATDLLRYEAPKIIGSVFDYNLFYMRFNTANILQYAMIIVVCLSIIFVIKKLFPNTGEQKKKELKCA